MSSIKNTPDEANGYENFDALYTKELELQRNFEGIEQAFVKVSEKYEDYSECKSFVEYLKTIEKVFVEAKYRSWDASRTKEELIKSKISILSSSGVIGEDVLRSIYDDFRKAGSNIAKINSVVSVLLEKYKENPDCVEFILYIQDMFVNFYESERENLSLDQLKERLIKTRMKVLSSDGSPELITLENIYKEFLNLINTKI